MINLLRQLYVTWKHRPDWRERFQRCFEDYREHLNASVMRFRSENIIAEIAEIDQKRDETLAQRAHWETYQGVKMPVMENEDRRQYVRALMVLAKQRRALLDHLAFVTTRTSEYYMCRCNPKFWIKRRLRHWISQLSSWFSNVLSKW